MRLIRLWMWGAPLAGSGQGGMSCSFVAVSGSVAQMMEGGLRVA